MKWLAAIIFSTLLVGFTACERHKLSDLHELEHEEPEAASGAGEHSPAAPKPGAKGEDEAAAPQFFPSAPAASATP